MAEQPAQPRRRTSDLFAAKSASIAEERERADKTKALKAYANDSGHFSLVRNFRSADIITLGNAASGVSCIYLCIHYLSLTANLPYAPSDRAIRVLYWAHVMPALGFGFDALDGRVARWRGGGSLLGQELDSLADLVSFGVAPSTLAFTLGLRLPLDIFSLILFVCAGLARLARYNATVALIPTGKSGSVKYFTGIPIPSSLAITGFMAFCVKMGKFVGAKGWVGTGQGLLDAVKETVKGGVNVSAGHVDWREVRQLGDLPGGVVRLFGKEGGWGEVHVLSFVFLAWAAAMVSKTLKIPKL